MPEFLPAKWAAPDNVVAGTTTRRHGVSLAPYVANNLALHVGDDPRLVEENRQALDRQLPGKKSWQWLEQVHGTQVVKAPAGKVPVADACFTDQPATVCTVLTADCLPILLCNRHGTEVAAIHAGWRSLCHGVIEKTVATLQSTPAELLAWLGPAIGPSSFEVGEDVRTAFLQGNCGSEAVAAFVPKEIPGKYCCNIYLLAEIRLRSVGVNQIHGGDYCTVEDKENFYSYRRDGVTGRMASFIYFIDR